MGWIAAVLPWKLRCVVVLCIITQSVGHKRRGRFRDKSSSSSSSSSSADSVCGNQRRDSNLEVTAWNTFQDSVDTQGMEMIWDTDGPTSVNNRLEFSLFPSNPPDNNSPLGFYDIDFTSSSIVYTLRDNSAASHLIFPDGSFDRYYFHFTDRVVTDASIVKRETSIKSKVEVLPAGFTADLIDPFNTGITIPEMPNGGLLVSVVPGADITELGQNIVVCYSLAGDTCGASGWDSDIDMTVWNTFEDAVDTQGMEMIWDVDGPKPMADGVDFHLFPSNPPDNDSPLGFYDIDVSRRNIVYTLRDNSAASHLVFPEGSFDRYYFDFGLPVKTASIVTDESSILSTVEILKPGFTVDLIDPFGTGIESPNLENGGLLVSVVPGADITELGQHIVICYSLRRNNRNKRGSRNNSRMRRKSMRSMGRMNRWMRMRRMRNMMGGNRRGPMRRS